MNKPARNYLLAIAAVGAAAILLISLITLVVDAVDKSDKQYAAVKAKINKEWKERYPTAYGKKHFYCNELGFLTRAMHYGNNIAVYLVIADNDVPIRCKTDHHQTIENAGKTHISTSTVF